MEDQSLKFGKIGALKSVAKKLTELRKEPISQKVFEIIDEHYNKNKVKKIAKSNNEAQS
jgi:hypothetical protein